MSVQRLARSFRTDKKRLLLYIIGWHNSKFSALSFFLFILFFIDTIQSFLLPPFFPMWSPFGAITLRVYQVHNLFIFVVRMSHQPPWTWPRIYPPNPPKCRSWTTTKWSGPTRLPTPQRGRPCRPAGLRRVPPFLRRLLSCHTDTICMR